MKTSELTGSILDWAVAECESIVTQKFRESPNLFYGTGFDIYRPSTNWAQGGPIIERENLFLTPQRHAWLSQSGVSDGRGETPLIAAMRCYVASKLGYDVEIPKELINVSK